MNSIRRCRCNNFVFDFHSPQNHFKTTLLRCEWHTKSSIHLIYTTWWVLRIEWHKPMKPSPTQSMLLLLLSHFSHVQLCATPSLGFSRQEHWSGLPFPFPMHKSEKWKVKVKSLSHVWLFAIPWTAAYQAPLSMEFFRQEYWSRLPFPSPGDLLDPGIKSRSPALQADSLLSESPVSHL